MRSPWPVTRAELNTVLDLVAGFAGVASRDDLLHQHRRKWRGVAMAVLKRRGFTATSIAGAFNRDHTTVLESIKLAEENGEARSVIERAVRAIHAQASGDACPCCHGSGLKRGPLRDDDGRA